jgi:hypothetical protein
MYYHSLTPRLWRSRPRGLQRKTGKIRKREVTVKTKEAKHASPASQETPVSFSQKSESAAKENEDMNQKTVLDMGFAGYDFKKVSDDVVKFVRFSFDTAYQNMVKIQDLQEKVVRETLTLGKDIQADAVKVMDRMIEDGKKGREDFKKMVEDGFSKAAEVR